MSRLRRWLSTRHRLRNGTAVIRRGHARAVAAPLSGNERAARRPRPGSHDRARDRLPTLHLAVTGVLPWLHQRHAAAFAFVRTPLLLASAFSFCLCDRAAAACRDPHRRHRLERARQPQSRFRQLALQPVRRRPEHARCTATAAAMNTAGEGTTSSAPLLSCAEADGGCALSLPPVPVRRTGDGF
jgi:hypothetical protein